MKWKQLDPKKRLTVIVVCLLAALLLNLLASAMSIASALAIVLIVTWCVALFAYSFIRGLGYKFVLSYTDPNADKKERIAAMKAMLDDPTLPRRRRLWITKASKGDDAWDDDDDFWTGGGGSSSSSSGGFGGGSFGGGGASGSW